MWLWQMVTFTVTHTNVKKQMQVNYHHTEFQTACIKKNQTAQKPKQNKNKNHHQLIKVLTETANVSITIKLHVSPSILQLAPV